MSKIQVLDTVTIDKIAAGEVIERPASVVKELVENAIDAGATAIVVEIQEGGTSLIRIADNGCGIEKEEVPNAFRRHATSKIRSVEDLVHIGSLGFRGEALSSIAAVSQVELITKTKGQVFGTRYRINGGAEVDIEDTGARDGTTFLIRQLFYNVPARRKFLKTPMTEASHVGDLMTRLALSHPEISFQFINNGQSKLHSSGNGSLRDVIYHVYGRDIASNLLKAQLEAPGMRISGFLGKPIVSRGNRNFENYFINGRYVKNQIVSKAIEDAYKDFSMQHKYPFVALLMEIDGEGVDVNVHPAKLEIRFHNQQEIYNRVFEAVSQGLHREELIPHVELDVPGENTRKDSGEYQRNGGNTGGRRVKGSAGGIRKDEGNPETGKEEEKLPFEGLERLSGAAGNCRESVPGSGNTQTLGGIPKSGASRTEGYVAGAGDSQTLVPALESGVSRTEGYVPESGVAQIEGYVPESGVSRTEGYVPESGVSRTEGYVPESEVFRTGGYASGSSTSPNSARVPNEKLSGGLEEDRGSGKNGGFDAGLRTSKPVLPPPSERDLDYFMEKMRMRVKEYHSRRASAEVADRNGIFKPEIQSDRIRETVEYAKNLGRKQSDALSGGQAFETADAPKQLDFFEEKLLTREAKDEYHLIGQVFETYWLVEFRENLYIIDQHAAHERILYERTLKSMKTREFTSQMVSPPIILELSMQEADLLNRYRDQFTRIGFEFEDFGQESFAVRAVPDNLFCIAKKELLLQMLDGLADEVNRNLSPEIVDEKVASMSCKAAVKGNMKLSAAEVDALIGELLTLENPYHCPHGRPTIIAMSRRELEKKFKRIV